MGLHGRFAPRRDDGELFARRLGRLLKNAA
jgi:hypothetical protein